MVKTELWLKKYLLIFAFLVAWAAIVPSCPKPAHAEDFTFKLEIPKYYEAIFWTVEQIPFQAQATFKNGVSVSYSAEKAPCDTKVLKEGWYIYNPKSAYQNVCYRVFIAEPLFVRSPWTPVTQKTYKGSK